ncbi:peroxide stress protein YaaA [Thomasclavelia sp.]|uniref:peroxide stress protein YaaA n=1 Tax=Thomasclavelia sp. TaxID=3025757 RepID=UPI0025DA170D|nr:peroxide stress protein YaaA [Thomasclavelia sp.]
MKIITTPAKKMTDDIAFLKPESQPVYLDKANEILAVLKQLDVKAVKRMLKCSDNIAKMAYQNYQLMDLNKNTVPAILAYQGIQYDYLAAHIMSYDDFAFMQEHLVILSGLYGVLKPLDGVVPYRLELNNYFKIADYASLYQFWNNKIYQELIKDDDQLLDLGANQYSKIIKKYLTPEINYVKCYFKEEIDDKLKEIGVYVKMARGAMTRYLVENRITNFEDVKKFQELGYHYRKDLSSFDEYIFVRQVND